MHLKKVKADKVGECRLCGANEKLTYDHVPPKACGNRSSTEIQTFYSIVVADAKPKVLKSQDGLKIRSICSHCNNTVFGSEYDPSIASFFDALINIRNSSLTLPDSVLVKCSPDKITRGVTGHLVAAKIDRDDAVFDERAREYALKPQFELPGDFHIYGWLHPYPQTIVLRDFGIFLGEKPATCQFLACFPFAFLVCTEPAEIDALYLNPYIRSRADVLPISLKNVHPYGWPWHPDRVGVVIGGEALMESAIAKRT